jgi:HEAT repeat protein
MGLMIMFGSTLARGQSATTVAGRSLEEYAAELNTADRVVRLRAVRSLGPFGEAAGPALRTCLDHEDAAVRYLAAVQFGQIGGDGLIDANQRLKELAGDQASIAVQIAASYALCRSGEIDQYLTNLVAALQHPLRGVCCSAAELIGQLGPDASAAIPALEAAFEANRPGTRRGDAHLGGAVQNALRKIKATPAIESEA